jgi:transposase
MGGDPLSGDLYVFFNKRRDAVKILLYERSGFAVWHKVLERGSYSNPPTEELSYAELWCVLEGIEIEGRKRKKC